MIYLAPASLIAAVMGYGMIQGIHHPWLHTVFLATSVISVVMMLLASGLIATMQAKTIKHEKELELANSSFKESKAINLLLQSEIEKLTVMREIQMSSHIDTFSDLLRNILKVTHIATEARAMTIFLESDEQFGIVHPKTHMRWEPSNSALPGETFIFFENELKIHDNSLKHIEDFSVHLNPAKQQSDQRSVLLDLLFEGEVVGELHYSPSFDMNPSDEKVIEKVKEWSSQFRLMVARVYSCWQTRSPVTHEFENITLISVPIITQGIIIGVLSAEFTDLSRDGSFNEELRKVQETLSDYGRNIGQPLKKEELYEQAIKDAMTGLFNKAHYENQLAEHFNRMQRYNSELCFIFVDIDHFKNVNDTYGHATGDIAIKSVARILMDNIRKTDTAFRIGGEELCVLLVETGIDEAMNVAEKLRSIIESTDFPKDGGGHINFTSSFGVACMDSTMKKPHDLANAADEALYFAKHNGRNRVVNYLDMKS